MPRTPIPEHLIHRPEEVERDAERFDHLCRLAEEVSFPVVQEALTRETAATGAEVLTEEAKHALEMLTEDAAILMDIGEREVLEAVQKSFSEQLPPPDEEECHQHARDLSQVLMSAWLETLRGAHRRDSVLVLSEYLLPEVSPSGLTWFMQLFGSAKPKLSETFTDAISTFAVNAHDATTIMSTLRLKLFTEPRLVDLPFDLAMISAPGKPVLSMTRSLYDRLVEAIKRHVQDHKPISPMDFEIQYRVVAEKTEPAAPFFTTTKAQRAVNSLTERLTPAGYAYVAKVASPGLQTETLQTEVMHALSSG